MPTVIRYSSFNEFYSQNEPVLYENPLQNHFLIYMSQEILVGRVGVYQSFNVVDEEKGLRITALHVENFLLLYSDQFTPTMLRLLSAELNYPQFERHMMAGSKVLIMSLLATNNAPFEVHKDRNIYKCEVVADPFNSAPGELQMGHIEDLEQIVGMGEAFSTEYDQPGEAIDMGAAMLEGIMIGTVYTWVDNNKICAMLQVMLESYDFPVIGTFYTEPAERGKGYGASLVHGVTKGLLEAGNDYCMLSTDAKTPGSNRAFEKAGYKKIGDYLLGYKTG